MRSLRGGAIVFLGIAVASTTAPAQAAETTAFVRLDVYGASDPGHDLDKEVRDALSDKLPLVSVRRVQQTLAEHPELGSCTTADCLKQLGVLLEARFLVRGQVKQETSQDVNGELRLFDAGTGQELASAPLHCDLCAWTELREGVNAAAKVLATRAASEKPLAQQPPPLPPQLPPDQPPTRPEPRPGLALNIAGGVALVAAVGLIVTGAVMIANDGKCAVTIPASAPDALCPKSYDTTLEGSLFVAGGGVMAAASAGLFVAAARSARVVPTVSSSRDGVMFSLRLRY